jgi:hypothetical protein
MTQNQSCGCTPECPITWGTCHCGCSTPTRIAPQNSAERGWVRGQPVRYRRGHAPRNINHTLSDLDETRRTATCSLCGSVSIKRNGASGWRCHRGIIAKHRIVEVDEEARTGYCRACSSRVDLLRHTRDGWVCKPNKVKTAQAWRDANIERHREMNRAWRDANRDRIRSTHLAKKYGLTVEQYEAMIAGQGGVCAVCRQPPRPEHRGGMLHVDHDHETGVVRGALCASCNLLLGLAGDAVEVLRGAIEYLLQHQDLLPVAPAG